MPKYDWENPKTYRVISTGLKPPSSNYSVIECPFCETRFRAYWWSISGGGKKCPTCGALHNGSGGAAKVVK